MTKVSTGDGEPMTDCNSYDIYEILLYSPVSNCFIHYSPILFVLFNRIDDNAINAILDIMHVTLIIFKFFRSFVSTRFILGLCFIVGRSPSRFFTPPSICWGHLNCAKTNSRDHQIARSLATHFVCMATTIQASATRVS